MSFYIHPTALADEGCQIGEGTRIWHWTHIMSTARIGSQCSIGQNVFVGPDVVVGDRVKIQNNVSLYTGVIVEDEAFLGPSMVFTNVINPRSGIERKDQFRPTYVRRGATVGANATLVCGNEIGEYSFVAAGAVVTLPVPPFALVMGTPARISGWVSRAGHRLDFDTNGLASCPEGGEQYQLLDNRVKIIKE